MNIIATLKRQPLVQQLLATSAWQRMLMLLTSASMWLRAWLDVESHRRGLRVGLIVTALLFWLWWFFSADPAVVVPEPVVAPLPKPSLGEWLARPDVQHGLLLGVAAVLGLLVMALLLDLGTITLSTQSLAHRRNVMFAFCVILLAETFSVDIAASLGVQAAGSELAQAGDAIARTDSPLKETVNKYAYGLLGFFLLYSYVEYVFTFVSDYLKSRHEWLVRGSRMRQANLSDKTGLLGNATLFAIGVYRGLFDVLLPTAALVFVVGFYGQQIKGFAVLVRSSLTCQHPQVAEFVGQSQQQIDTALADIYEHCPQCLPAVEQLREQTHGLSDLLRSSLDPAECATPVAAREN